MVESSLNYDHVSPNHLTYDKSGIPRSTFPPFPFPALYSTNGSPGEMGCALLAQTLREAERQRLKPVFARLAI